jgi:formate-dependent nitrite reductase membrane component NrfD
MFVTFVVSHEEMFELKVEQLKNDWDNDVLEAIVGIALMIQLSSLNCVPFLERGILPKLTISSAVVLSLKKSDFVLVPL